MLRWTFLSLGIMTLAIMLSVIQFEKSHKKGQYNDDVTACVGVTSMFATLILMFLSIIAFASGW